MSKFKMPLSSILAKPWISRTLTTATVVVLSALLSGCILNLGLQSESDNISIGASSAPPNTHSKPTFHPIIWDEIRSKLYLTEANEGYYDRFINYYQRNPDYLQRVSKRAKPYLYYILTEVKKRNIPYEIALLPIIESGFRPIAFSHQSAVGLWQFIPSTAHQFDLDETWWYDARQDTIKSTQAALDYLQSLYKKNHNNWLLALASYNAGLGNVNKATQKYRKRHKNPVKQPTFWDIRPYLPKETQNYVPQLLAVSHAIKHANSLNLMLEPIANRLFFTEVILKKQINLTKAAALANLTPKALHQLNPGYLVTTTPPNGPFNLLLPVETSVIFKQKLIKHAELFDIQWIHHKIRSGDSLSMIAHKYKTTKNAIKKLNKMRNSYIRLGKTLIIPVQAEFTQNLEQPRQLKSYKGAIKIHRVKAGE